MKCAENIAAGIQDYEIIVDELSLEDLMTDYHGDDTETIPPFYFECIEDNYMIFTGLKEGKEVAKAYCTFDANHSGFEIKMVKYELIIDGVSEVVEEEKTIAMVNAYQPLLTIMEKMLIISNNVRLAVSNNDIEEFVIKE
jgi:hypothetical protein